MHFGENRVVKRCSIDKKEIETTALHIEAEERDKLQSAIARVNVGSQCAMNARIHHNGNLARAQIFPASVGFDISGRI